MLHHFKHWVLLVLLCLFLTGCYGKSELDDLAYVIAMGADLSPSGDTENIQITYQVAIPIKITGENNETGKQTFTTYTTIAPSLSIANSNINAITSKKVDLSHVSLIIYSEEFARKGLEGHVNSLISDVSIRPRTIVSICENSAKEFLESVTPVLETSPARYFELLVSSSYQTGKSVKTEILKFYTASQSPYVAPVAVMARLDENQEAQLSGIAVFNGLQMIGKIDEEKTIGHLLLTNQLNEACLQVPFSEKENQYVTITIKEIKKPKIKVTILPQTPTVSIKLFIDAHLESNGNAIDFYQKENEEIVNRHLQKKIKDILEEYLKETTLLKVDASGLGRFAKKNYLTWAEFENIHWDDIYPNLQYQIEVESSLNVSQIISHFIPTN